MIGEHIKNLESVEEFLRSMGEYRMAANVNAASWAMYEYWQELIRIVTPDPEEKNG